MTYKRRFIVGCTLLLAMCTCFAYKQANKEKPKVCITFDDGNPRDMPGYDWQQWNSLLLNGLKKHNKQAVFFIKGSSMSTPLGLEVLSSWDAQGHYIANHTYNHKSYNKSTFEEYKADFLKNDSLISQYKNYVKLFRFPYLKEGETKEKRDDFRNFLKTQNYRNGYVTIDASDWYIDSRLVKRLKQDPKANLEPYRKYYLEHIYDHAVFYNNLSNQLTGRQINHTLLLHHNLAAALFIDDLIKMFEAKGWEVINASEVYKDPVYQIQPDIVPAGESLIWGMAKEKGTFEDILRYPAEDSRYEEPAMDKLGL